MDTSAREDAIVDQSPCSVRVSYDEWRGLIERRLQEDRERLDRELGSSSDEKDVRRYHRILEEFETQRRLIPPRDIFEWGTDPSKVEGLRITYLSDGLKIAGYVYGPRRKSERYPAVIFNRGGNRAFSALRYPGSFLVLHALVAAGFYILASQYRGGPGSEGQDEFGGADVHDVLNLETVARALGFVDMNNLFMFGVSRGGMMTLLALKHGMPLNAAAVHAAPTDLAMGAVRRPEMESNVYAQLMPEFETRREEHCRTRSALCWPEAIERPLLMLHGSADWRVSAEESLALAQLLQRLGRTYGLVIYGGDDHMLSQNREDRDRRMVQWFQRYLR